MERSRSLEELGHTRVQQLSSSFQDVYLLEVIGEHRVPVMIGDCDLEVFFFFSFPMFPLLHRSRESCFHCWLHSLATKLRLNNACQCVLQLLLRPDGLLWSYKPLPFTGLYSIIGVECVSDDACSLLGLCSQLYLRLS